MESFLQTTEHRLNSTINNTEEFETGKNLSAKKFLAIIFLLITKLRMKYFEIQFVFLESLDHTYYTSPDIPEWVFKSSSVIMAIIGLVGICSNLGVIAAYMKNKTVRTEFWMHI